MSWYKIDISINYVFDDSFDALIRTDEPTVKKNYRVRYTSRVTIE
jgi:hypothetical protein